MLKIIVTPPNQPSFSGEFSSVSDAYDFLEVLRVYGYEAAQQSVQRTGAHGEDCNCDKCYNDGVLLDEYLARR